MQHFAKVQNHKTIFSLLIVDVIVLPTNKLLYRFFFAIFNLFCILNKWVFHFGWWTTCCSKIIWIFAPKTFLTLFCSLCGARISLSLGLKVMCHDLCMPKFLSDWFVPTDKSILACVLVIIFLMGRTFWHNETNYEFNAHHWYLVHF